MSEQVILQLLWSEIIGSRSCTHTHTPHEPSSRSITAPAAKASDCERASTAQETLGAEESSLSQSTQLPRVYLHWVFFSLPLLFLHERSRQKVLFPATSDTLTVIHRESFIKLLRARASRQTTSQLSTRAIYTQRTHSAKTRVLIILPRPQHPENIAHRAPAAKDTSHEQSKESTEDCCSSACWAATPKAHRAAADELHNAPFLVAACDPASKMEIGINDIPRENLHNQLDIGSTEVH